MKSFISKTCLSLALLQAIAYAQNQPASAALDPVLVTISKETTRITEPLKPSGYPDFLEAENIAARGQVTPETNGLLLILHAVGPNNVTPEQTEEFYRRLGIDPPTKQRHEYVSYAKFVEQLKPAELPKANAKERAIKDRDERNQARRERVELEFDECGEIPWTSKDHPLVARWLEEQKESLSELDRLRDYPEAYLPLVTGKQNRSLLLADNPGREMIRRVALDLRIRALNSIAEKNYDAALDDVERLFVMRRYLLQRNHFSDLLTSNSMRWILHPVIFHLALSEDLTP